MKTISLTFPEDPHLKKLLLRNLVRYYLHLIMSNPDHKSPSWPNNLSAAYCLIKEERAEDRFYPIAAQLVTLITWQFDNGDLYKKLLEGVRFTVVPVDLLIKEAICTLDMVDLVKTHVLI